MTEQKKSAPTAETVQGTNENHHVQNTTGRVKKQDLDALLIAEVWDCALKILNDSGGDYIVAKREVSRLVHFAPVEHRLKKWIRKMLRTALYYQVTRNLLVPVSALKGATT